MVGSNVKVLLDSDVHYGVIRWIGTPPGTSPGKLMAAVELVSKMDLLNELFYVLQKNNRTNSNVVPFIG